MSITIISRTRGTLDHARRMERIVDKYTKQRAEIDKNREPDRQTTDKDRHEQSRAKLEQRGFFKRDR